MRLLTALCSARGVPQRLQPVNFTCSNVSTSHGGTSARDGKLPDKVKVSERLFTAAERRSGRYTCPQDKKKGFENALCNFLLFYKQSNRGITREATDGVSSRFALQMRLLFSRAPHFRPCADIVVALIHKGS